MLNITTRTTPEQMDTLQAQIVRGDDNVLIHSMRHNLDGLWLNIEYTDADGDWIASIDRNGNLERTQ